jgi:hypothetical protein
MASRLDQFQEFKLIFESPWNLAGKTEHSWTQSFYVSGTITHNDADAEAAGLALAAPALALAGAATSLIGITYYPSQSLVSTTNKVYAAGTHKGTRSAYTSPSGSANQLEVAIVAHCPIGKNTKGKTIYLRKYFHDVQSGAGDPNAHDALVDATALLAPFNVGAGPHSVVPCSPTSGHTGGPWTIETHLYTHQLRKGKKKKKPTAGFLSQLISLGMDAASAAALIRAIAAAA